MTTEEDLAGCVTPKDGGKPVPFNEWYWALYGEAPSMANLIRRRNLIIGERRGLGALMASLKGKTDAGA